MSLVTLKEVLEIAERTNTAIPGFNIDNIEIPEAIMEAAEAENCPVILTIGQGAINAGGLRHLRMSCGGLRRAAECRWSCIWTTASATTGPSLA